MSNNPSKEQEIREALAAATPGPWAVVTFLDGKTREIWHSIDNAGIARIVTGEDTAANAHLISHTPEWLQYLLTEAERERLQREMLQADYHELAVRTQQAEAEVESLRSQLEAAERARLRAFKELPDELFQKAGELDRIKAGEHPDWTLRSWEDQRDINFLEQERDDLKIAVLSAQQLANTCVKNSRMIVEANASMREALQWYADDKNWKLGVSITMGSAFPLHEAIKSDKGEHARAALASISLPDDTKEGKGS